MRIRKIKQFKRKIGKWGKELKEKGERNLKKLELLKLFTRSIKKMFTHPLVVIKAMINNRKFTPLIHLLLLTYFSLFFFFFFIKKRGEGTNSSCWAHCFKKTTTMPQQKPKYTTALLFYTIKWGLLQCLSITITFLNLRIYFK